MRYRKLNENLDYTMGCRPEDAFYEKSEAVVQAIVTRLNLLLAEWWEDLDDGLPLFEQILGQFSNPEDVDLTITARIVGTRGIKHVSDVSHEYDIDTRKYSYSSTVETIYGDVFPLNFGFDGLHFKLI